MHLILKSIQSELDQLAAQVRVAIPNNEPIGIAHNNWSFPAVTRDELVAMATSIADLIADRGTDDLGDYESLLADYPRRLVFLRSQTCGQLWGSAASAVPAYWATLNCLRKALEGTFGNPAEEAALAAKSLQTLSRQLRAIEARLADLSPRSASVEQMVTRIEEAYEAADQLPADLEVLREARAAINQLQNDSDEDRAAVNRALQDAVVSTKSLEKMRGEAAAIIQRCDAAYRATTSEGLASAFAERSVALTSSMWVWVVGLITALVIGGAIGSNQLRDLALAIKAASPQEAGMVWLHLALSLLSIGGPVWFAWIATKQIGQRFRLAEDYGYKASISKAYEGYRREAALLDPEFQARLFDSALGRLDELPLRLVETATHGSPWQELASSEIVKQAVKAIPGFAEQVNDLAKAALATAARRKDVMPPAEMTTTNPGNVAKERESGSA